MKSGLTWDRHHGKSRLAGLDEIERVNLVLTTYHTVSAESKRGDPIRDSILFSTRWKRVILDEGLLFLRYDLELLAYLTKYKAHFIRNSASQMSKAICALRASSRWAVTGTPIQNRLGDLTSLLKFLQVYPYGDAKRFDSDIILPWKAGEVEEAVKRLKRLSGCLILRRPKEAIELPSRRDLRCVVDFQHDERMLYEDIKARTIALRDDALRYPGVSQPATFVNVIQQINSLRMICNMGIHYHSRHDYAATQATAYSTGNWAGVAQQTFDFECEGGSICCRLCSSFFSSTEALLGWNKYQGHAMFSECLAFICSECVQKLQNTTKPLTCGHNPPHPIAPVSTNAQGQDEVGEMPLMTEYDSSALGLPSKVVSLMEQLQAQPPGTKR